MTRKQLDILMRDFLKSGGRIQKVKVFKTKDQLAFDARKHWNPKTKWNVKIKRSDEIQLPSSRTNEVRGDEQA